MPYPNTVPPSAGTPTSILLTTEEAAAALGLPVRTFHTLRREPWMPAPIVLGPRLVRWAHSELMAAVGRMPRAAATDEPAQLAAARLRGRSRPAPFDGATV
jgi:predicted DNA-binding transcriptional regulator AlpA